MKAKHLPPYVCVCPVQTDAVRSNEDPVHITWSSSGSEQSDDEAQRQHLSGVAALQQQRPHRPVRPVAPIQSYTRELSPDKGTLNQTRCSNFRTSYHLEVVWQPFGF